MSDWLKRIKPDYRPPVKPASPSVASKNSAKRYVVIDCETTGLSPESGDRLISFAAIEIMDDAPSGRALNLIFNPGRKSNPHALRVHGLADHVLRYQPEFVTAAGEIHGFLGDAVIIGHNVSFDVEFLRHEFGRLGLSWTPAGQICTMQLFAATGAGSTNLDAAAAHFGIDVSARGRFHNAFADAEITSRLFQVLHLRCSSPTAVLHLDPTNYVPPPPLIQLTDDLPGDDLGGAAELAFAITGELASMSREQAIEAIEASGGTFHKTVRRDTDFLVVGDAPGSTKLDTAAARRSKYGKPTNIDEARFLHLLNATQSVQTP